MAESERRQRVITSTPRLTADDIANRSFASSFRGYAEPEVRAFLRRVSEEYATAHDRENELLDALQRLEEQLRAPKPLDEQQLLDALGEETARLLRSARDAADDIRRKAEERASNIIEEAQTDAHRVRTEAAEILGVRTQEAEAAAAEVVSDAHTRAVEIRAGGEHVVEELRTRAQQEADAAVETARQQGREMLDEARSARERVLTDLGRRRTLLQAQVEELRQGRDRLIEAYRVVKRTFQDAIEALTQVEARAASERAHATSDAPGEREGESDAFASTATDTAAGPDTIQLATDDAGATLAEIPGPTAPPAPDLAAVDSLFARIRAGRAEANPPTAGAPIDLGDDPAAAAERPDEAVHPPPVETDSVETDSVETDSIETDSVETDSVESDAVESGPPRAAVAWRARHHEAVEPLLSPLFKNAKRSAQDDQNALLDAVRRHKGRPSAEQVVRNGDDMRATWSDVLRPALDDAYNAGREAVGADRSTAPGDLVRESAETIAFPLRDRLVVAIDDPDSGDTSGLVERIGARYREWKNQQLQDALGDVMVAAWSRGVYDGSHDGTILQWVPLREGRCADCDDNALEPTVKGDAFPTGQLRPPAHPGCRCLLAPSAVVARLSSP